MPTSSTAKRIVVDVGNSRLKLGRIVCDPPPRDARRPLGLPSPDATLALDIDHQTGHFDAAQLLTWCREHAADGAVWLVASVHRAAADRLAETVAAWSAAESVACPLRRVTYRDVSIAIKVDEPGRVGIDRLLAAFAADKLRTPDRPAVVVDLGTAITVDLLDAAGAFRGGAILPGIALSARALEEHTDALPRVALDRLEQPPPPVGTSTIAAIESGLYWGAVGAVRELIFRASAELSAAPEVFLTGGASNDVAELLARDAPWPVHYAPHLVLSGIALIQP